MCVVNVDFYGLIIQLHFANNQEITKVREQIPHIERFHSRDQQPYWITETKESICGQVGFKSKKISFISHHGRHSSFLDHQHGRRDVM